ncbi:TPA: 2-octaprenyl-6-methoxyphenyl hydroxylase [Vibrio vulnificus]|uniref:2-octaprenyl-6-methoxyphenyl hydroxylase n=1 Tax=Vibrio vulnificus TaxID=672 RepID=UPI0019D424E3|nr:2-octaprenyl-6-methoxyphenyl hydroxylase [Vibrio vulnificus]MBN8104963.1 2-octaprenyl-6-methoxyphenyl hydroxylase [Vibrio vulnificus]HAS6067173.1 2-octaprenyl-6-methoxyphenyl hydroxylase [Vibrio vulnificus]HDY7923792.1 2-octaprenyl-6-methoxyphenyl hydroxylase [Vibrio vulnificus]HDY8196747.1 2-octaprenyl-6-methoxyphenyl hydroxylase [Vibrio vulnificus]
MTQYDVVIAGGAMAGATLALALSHLTDNKLNVAVVEPYQVDTSHPGFDSRSIALSYGTVDILRRFQLWSSIAPCATPITDIHVSDRSHLAMTDISAQQVGVDALGYVVELADVGSIYQSLLQRCESISLYTPAAVERVERFTDSVAVHLNNGETLQAKLLVAADGAVSNCCQQLGMPLAQHDFAQTAVIANVVTEQAHRGRAFERFTEHGPVALLPMSDNRMSLVWCLPPDLAEQVMLLSEEQFLARLQQEFGWRLGQMQKVGMRASYPLISRHREQNISHRFAVVGNAAQTLHPIAGQGFNLGIRDVASLAEEITKQLDDVGAYSSLMRFKQRRCGDRQNTIWMTTSLVHLFSNDYLALRVARNLGLVMMDNLSGLKQPLLRQTLGLVSR